MVVAFETFTSALTDKGILCGNKPTLGTFGCMLTRASTVELVLKIILFPSKCLFFGFFFF